MDDFERRVSAEIGRLEGPDFPTGRLARRQRDATIRALAEATLNGRSWTGEQGALGPNRDRMVVSANNFYVKKHWYPHPLTREVIDNVTALYKQRDAAEKERARQAKRDWLEKMEISAAEKQFEKAALLLDMPHVSKKSKQVVDGVEQTILLAPANATVFNAAVNMNVKASDLMRRSLALPTEVRRSELTGAEGGAIVTRNDPMDEASDDQVQSRLAALAKGTLAVIEGIDVEPVASDATGAEDDDPVGQA